LDTLNSLIINGTGTSSVWKNLIDSVNYTYKFNISKIDDGYSPSDNTSFYAQNIPVLFFFTGLHKDYHRPSDDADKINFSGESVVLNYAKDLILSMQNKEFDVIITPRKKETRMSYKVYVGTVPDFSFSGQGYKINSVTKDSPADKAGIKGGDIIVKFGEVNVANIYDYTYALSKYNIGDEVDVVVQRNTEQLKLKVVLTGR
jgi:C-terminal processing protease CtpA/Prc